MVRLLRIINALAAFLVFGGVLALEALVLRFFILTWVWFLPALVVFGFFVFAALTLVLKDRARKRALTPSDTRIGFSMVNILHHRFSDEPAEASDVAKRVQQAIDTSQPKRVRRCKDCGQLQLEYPVEEEPIIVVIDRPDRELRWGWAVGLQLFGVRLNRRIAR